MPDLGRYALWVLSAYGGSLLLIGLLVWSSLRHARRAKAELTAEEAAQDG